MVGMKDQNCPYRMRTQNLLPKFEPAKTPFATTTKVEAGKFEVSRHTKVSAPVTAPAQVSVTPIAPVKPEPVKVAPAIMETRPLFGPDLQPAIVPAVAPAVAPVVAIPISVVAEKTEISEPVEIKIEVAAPVQKVAVRPQTENPFAEMVDGMNATDGKDEVKTVKVTKAKPQVLGGLLKKLNPLGYLPKPSRNQPKAGRTAVQTELSLERIKVIRNDLHDADLEIVAPKPAGKSVAPPSRLQTLAKTEAAALGRMTAKFFGAEETQVH